MQHTPTEIVNEIFKHLVSDILLVHDPRIFPWYIGQICTSWRMAFTSTPWIWRKFIIDVDQVTERDLDGVTRLVKLCVQRSKDQPLSFSFSFSYTHQQRQRFHPTRVSHANQILSGLIVEARRWEVIDVDTGLFSLEAFHLPNLPDHFPLLHSISLRSDGILWDEPKFRDVFLRACSLAQVEMECFPAHDFDWSRLTELTLHYASNVADVLPVFRQLRCIEKLQLNTYIGKADEEQDGMIALPKLKTLSCPGNILRHLQAPGLEELRMNAIAPLPLPDGAISFFRTSSGSLKRLILGNLCCIDSDAKRILQHLPKLTHLCLEVDVDLSGVLPYNLEEGVRLLPRLEMLIVDGYLRRWDAVETLHATVASRSNELGLPKLHCGAGKLRELRLINAQNFDTSYLRTLCEEREVKFLAWKRFQRAGHNWCANVQSCAFDLCNLNSLFGLTTETLM